jgi:2-dehydropantoate 2-reductase
MTHVAVVGPGAIGATFAAAVQEAGGHELMLCARRPLERIAIERDGGARLALEAPILTEPDSTGPVDWVLLAVKAHQNEGARDWLRALCGPSTTVVVLQNGVEHRENVEPLAGRATVVPAIVWVPAEAVEPGLVRVRGPARVMVADDDPGRAFARLLGDAAQVELVDDFVTEEWRKLCANAVAGLMALAGRRSGMFAREDVRALSGRLARECVAVARAEGADLSDEAAEALVAELAALPPDVGTSILFDRLANRPLEWEARNGVVQRRGARHGIPTPISDVIVPLLAAASDAG